jgi:pectate lyase
MMFFLREIRTINASVLILAYGEWLTKACLLLLLLGVVSPSLAAMPAFPGAEGGGAEARGGRGGAVYKVSNLNDSGPGSLRAAIEASGPRVVVFDVSGTINLKSRLTIDNPYITIAGQTAPGGGIQLNGKNIDGCRQVIAVRAPEVIIRYLRIRKGVCPAGSGTSEATNIHIYPPTSGAVEIKNVIVDHVSAYWAQNINMSAYQANLAAPRVAPKNITFSYNIVAEMIRPHAVNMIVGANDPDANLAMTNIDSHNNLFAHATHRNPYVRNRSGQFINNLVYNWYGWTTLIENGAVYDVIGNVYKPGPMQKRTCCRAEILVSTDVNVRQMPAEYKPSVYAAGNIGPWNGTDNYKMVWHSDNSGNLKNVLADEFRRSSPRPDLPRFPITVRPASEIEAHLLPIVGASRRLDCMGNWVMNRDEVDVRVIEEYSRNQGFIPYHEDEVGGFPNLAKGEPCQDSNQDGVPDEWLIANGLDPQDPGVGSRVHPSGYTYLELYLSGTSASILKQETRSPMPPAAIDVR